MEYTLNQLLGMCQTAAQPANQWLKTKAFTVKCFIA